MKASINTASGGHFNGRKPVRANLDILAKLSQSKDLNSGVKIITDGSVSSRKLRK